jgi:hypothetical protein
MGIRIHRNTWSAPLRLIDSWLPPARPRPPVQHPISKVAQRFVQAGWLRRRASNDEHVEPQRPAGQLTATPASARPQPARATLSPSGGCGDRFRPDSRVVLSGRITEVCAELDRLAAQETRWLRMRS